MTLRSHSQPVCVYTPASQLSDPARLARAMLADIGSSRALAWRLLVRNLSARYRHTLLGWLWAFLPTLLTTAVFIFLQRAGYFTVGQMAVPYPVFVLAGLVLWQVFADAVNMPLQMVQQSYSMLTKINFPREALIIAGIGEVLAGFVIRFALLLGALLWFQLGISWTLLWVPCGVVVLVALGVGLGLMLAPVGILYFDVSQALPLVLYLWMFLTPVLYPVAPTGASFASALNPISPVLNATRQWLLSGTPEQLGGFFLSAGLATVVLMVGWLLYRLALPILLERIGA
jgi:lipopolysaccharide transport system permease protein